MNITTSYAIEIRHMNKIFKPTVEIFNEAVSFCIPAFEKHWSDLCKIKGILNQRAFGERLIHTTKNHTAVFPEFDVKFYKMPIYMMRSVINTALGHLRSYHSNLDNWYNNGCKGRQPKLQTKLHVFPTFFKDNMSKLEALDNDKAYLKLFIDNDWKWVTVQLKHTDMQYIRKHCLHKGMSAPILEKKHHKYFLRFVFEEQVNLKNAPVKEQRILAIDLGINTDATCSVMSSDGAILARKFINFPCEKDHLAHTLNKIKKVSRKYKGHNVAKLWRDAKAQNDELARKIAKDIAEFAVLYDVDVIVFEHLDTKGKKKGFKSKKQKLHMWKALAVQSIVTNKAHSNGMRISYVCAWNTSKLAFDGSGTVIRGTKSGFNTHELCKFQNGKTYNCDLNASYNIGARYFIRELLKPLSVTVRSCVLAKVPECMSRIQCTYNTLLKLNNAVYKY